METLTEPSIAPELRSESLIPISPDEERSVDHHHNNNNDDDEDIDLHPCNLLEEQSQSSQGSSSLVSPPPGGGGGDIPEETIENIARELHHSNTNSSSDNTCNDTTNDSQPEPGKTGNSSIHNRSPPGGSDKAPPVEIPVQKVPAIAVAPIPKVHIAPISNGSLALKSSGKPTTMRDLDRKMNKSSRGRSKRRAMVAMYQSEISENKIGIKLCIKKASDATVQQPKKASRKRTRKPKSLNRGDSDAEESTVAASPEKRTRRPRDSTRKTNNNTEKATVVPQEEYKQPEDQSPWAYQLPEHILCEIFQHVIQDDGCIPSLVRLGKVCSAWHKASLVPSLWRTVDLGNWAKDRFKTELKLKWLIENRLHNSTDVSFGNWKITNVQCVLDKLLAAAPNLVGITLTGWKQLTSDHLMFLVQEFKSLRRLDLSSINAEVNGNKTAVGQVSLCAAITEMGERLTHLYLAHNRLSGIPQIVKTLSTQCPNLVLLDLSNVSTVAISHGILNIEQLQAGCQKLKVLRITNSHINMSTATLQEQMDSLGFPELEELSVASLADESRLFNDEYLQRILKTSTKLKLLDVRGCSRLTHDSLIRLPTWDLKHLFLSGCSITRDLGSGLELISSKWAHSLIEFDLAWANATKPLDDALKALADKGPESPLNHLNLCGSSVSLEAVKEVLTCCPHINSINLSSCRGLPRGVKRLLQGPQEIAELRENLGVTLKQPKQLQ
ncbi:F-box/LRR-repeat protein 6 [Armigeres subalbatus]|uniref:F-box/LRR-repeat protein 6 n=1 Tax=Armigeres subalbatus TaxID=124917 RepID=UPI002ED307F5